MSAFLQVNPSAIVHTGINSFICKLHVLNYLELGLPVVKMIKLTLLSFLVEWMIQMIQ